MAKELKKIKSKTQTRLKTNKKTVSKKKAIASTVKKKPRLSKSAISKKTLLNPLKTTKTDELETVSSPASDRTSEEAAVSIKPSILTFRPMSLGTEVQAVFDYNIDAFSDSPDFHWGLPEIKQEIKEGWELYAAFLEKEVIAAIFLKKEGVKLLSKNTAIKIHHQGSGHSHQIKEFIEKMARKLKAREIYHYCRIDNFRMYSLNEKHGYIKTDKRLGPEGLVVEWVKKL